MTKLESSRALTEPELKHMSASLKDMVRFLDQAVDDPGTSGPVTAAQVRQLALSIVSEIAPAEPASPQ